MLKHLLMAWLVICTLGYGSVWAVEVLLDETADLQTLAADASHNSDDGGDSVPCDHCCHASAHILAVLASPSTISYLGSGTGYTPYRAIYSVNATAPPDHPPRT